MTGVMTTASRSVRPCPNLCVMSTASSMTLVALAGLLVACGGAPALPPAAPASTYIGAAPASHAETLGRFGRDTNGLLVLDDMRPYAEAVWKSDLVRTFLPAAGATEHPYWGWIPTRVAIGWSDAGVRSVDRLVHFCLHIALATAASDAPCTADDAERRRALDALVEAVKRFELVGLTVDVRFRTAEQASQAMHGLHGLLAGAAPSVGGMLTLQPGEGAFDVAFAAPAFWPVEATVEVLGELEIGRPGDDLMPLAAALGAVRLTARVEADGEWLSIRLGERSKAPPLTPADVALPLPEPTVRAAPVLSTWVDMGPWKRITGGWHTLWQRWRSTSTGRHLVALDSGTGGLLVDLEAIIRRAAEAGGRLMMRMDIDGGDLRAHVVERGVPAIPRPLEADGILRWLPTDAPAMGANRQQDLGRSMADLLWSLEERLDNRAMREEFGDEGPGAASALSDEYHRLFAELRRVILEEREHPYAAPYGWAITTPEGIPRLLIVSALSTPGASIAYFERLTTLLMPPLARALVPDARVRLVEADLGLEPTTYVLQGQRGDEAPEVLEARGFEPHVFEHDGVFVMSTDVALSRRALTRSGDHAALVDGKRSAIARVDPAALNAPLARLADAVGMEPGTRMVLFTALSWFAGIELDERFEGPDRVARHVVRFRNPAAKARPEAPDADGP